MTEKRDDYLWDRSGEPDGDVERLESLLGTLRSKTSPPELSERPVAAPRRFAQRWLPLAAAFAILAVGGWWLMQPGGSTGLEVERLDGSPTLASRTIAKTGRWLVGQSLVTDAVSRARISIGLFGEVDVEPNSILRLVSASVDHRRLALDRGSIQATIYAPPRFFAVETPSALAVDLGCVFSLNVGEDGQGVVRVTSGWVAFETGGRESFIPAGAMCTTRPGLGPGTPLYEDAAHALKSAVDRIDAGGLSPNERSAAIDDLLAAAREKDAFTLWHLLSRVDDGERGLVFDRLAGLVAPPGGVTRAGVLAGDREMLEIWWDRLGLGDTDWWRMWKLPEPPV